MNIKVAFLRSVNVGSHNRINMKLLTESMLNLGLKNVSTYIQSGNILFESDKPNLGELMKQKIERDFKLNIVVIIRPFQEIKSLIQDCPFQDTDNTYISLLSKNPSIFPNMATLNTKGDTCVLYKNNIYIHCLGQYHKTMLNNAFFEKKLGLSATTRNMRTMQEIANLWG